MASKFRQEMPPHGGYGPVDWAKKLPRRGLGGYGSFALLFSVMGAAWVGYYFERQAKKKWRIEMNDARIAMEPLLMAEQNRLFLRQILKNRDDENELMKDNPDWVTGKWQGKPLYHNVAGRFIAPSVEEYYAHAGRHAYYSRMMEKTWH